MRSIPILAYDVATSFNLGSLRTAAADWGSVVSKDPVVIALPEEQYVAIFDYGSIVFFNCDAAATQKWIERLSPFVTRMSRQQYADSFTIHVGKAEGEFSTEELYVPEFSLDVVKLVAIVLSRSVSLEYFEFLVDRSLGQLEDSIEQLAHTGRLVGSRRNLTRQVGFALNIQHELAYSLGLLDDPDVVWGGGKRMYDIYVHLSQVFDIRERAQILQRKIDIITKSSEFIIQRIQERTLTWQEYAIIALFVLDLFVIYWVGAK